MCTWMMHMITYTTVLTPLHISHVTHIPVPEGSVELLSISKHCGWGCIRIRMECTEEEEEEGTTLVRLCSRITYSTETDTQTQRERERESVHNIMIYMDDAHDHIHECTHYLSYQSPYSHPSSRGERWIVEHHKTLWTRMHEDEDGVCRGGGGEDHIGMIM